MSKVKVKTTSVVLVVIVALEILFTAACFVFPDNVSSTLITYWHITFIAELFACAGINSYHNDEIMKHLPEGKTPILLIFGDKIFLHKLGKFSADRVFKFSHLARMEEGKIIFDASHIHAQVGTLTALEESPAKSPGKNSKIGNLIIRLKQELREYMKGNYSALLQAERSNTDYEFPELKQSDLAVMLDVPRVYIKRAMDQDLELRTLFDAANNRNSTMAYASKARF
jgi:hypothetical protein